MRYDKRFDSLEVRLLATAGNNQQPSIPLNSTRCCLKFLLSSVRN
jgi:hypothetical protein